jgi:hypothetical protein
MTAFSLPVCRGFLGRGKNMHKRRAREEMQTGGRFEGDGGARAAGVAGNGVSGWFGGAQGSVETVVCTVRAWAEKGWMMLGKFGEAVVARTVKTGGRGKAWTLACVDGSGRFWDDVARPWLLGITISGLLETNRCIQLATAVGHKASTSLATTRNKASDTAISRSSAITAFWQDSLKPQILHPTVSLLLAANKCLQTASAVDSVISMAMQSSKSWLIATTTNVLLFADKVFQETKVVSSSVSRCSKSWLIATTITTLLGTNRCMQRAAIEIQKSSAALSTVRLRTSALSTRALSATSRSWKEEAKPWLTGFIIIVLFAVNDGVAWTTVSASHVAEESRRGWALMLQQFDRSARSIQSRIDWWRAKPRTPGPLDAPSNSSTRIAGLTARSTMFFNSLGSATRSTAASTANTTRAATTSLLSNTSLLSISFTAKTQTAASTIARKSITAASKTTTLVQKAANVTVSSASTALDVMYAYIKRPSLKSLPRYEKEQKKHDSLNNMYMVFITTNTLESARPSMSRGGESTAAAAAVSVREL